MSSLLRRHSMEKFSDTLNLEIDNIVLNDSLRNFGLTHLRAFEDSVSIHFVNPGLGKDNYYYKKRTASEYFFINRYPSYKGNC